METTISRYDCVFFFLHHILLTYSLRCGFTYAWAACSSTLSGHPSSNFCGICEDLVHSPFVPNIVPLKLMNAVLAVDQRPSIAGRHRCGAEGGALQPRSALQNEFQCSIPPLPRQRGPQDLWKWLGEDGPIPTKVGDVYPLPDRGSQEYLGFDP